VHVVVTSISSALETIILGMVCNVMGLEGYDGDVLLK
jgi:hypothetical protein